MAHSDSDTDPLADAATNDHPEPPAFNPRTFDAPAYDEIESHDDLIRYSKAYFAVVVAHYDMDVDASHVRGWEVSTRAKRRAAAVRSVDLSALGVFTATGMTSPDWDALREQHNDAVRRQMDGHTDVKDVTVVLTWEAYEAFSEEEWQATIRHEAIHVEQFHQYGDGGHGLTFKSRAGELSTSENCKKFSDFKYPFECPACGKDMGGRYRESKAVKFARLDREEQQEWMDSGDTYWMADCCDEPITLAE